MPGLCSAPSIPNMNTSRRASAGAASFRLRPRTIRDAEEAQREQDRDSDGRRHPEDIRYRAF